MCFTHKIIYGIILVLFLLPLSLSAADIYTQARVFYDDKYQRLNLLEMGLDIVKADQEYFEIITNPDQVNDLRLQGYKVDVVHSDLWAFYQSRLIPGKDMAGYKTLDEIFAYVDGIIADHPDLVSQKVDIGHTIQDRPMWAFKVSDNPEMDEDEPEILYTACIHAREVITPEVLLNFIDYLTDNYDTDAEAQDIVDNNELWFIPIVNPDGYYHNEYLISNNEPGMWRKNRRNNGDGTYGVDLNRNFGYEWGYDNYGSSPYSYDATYRGTAPFSEPETQNLKDFHIAHDFIISLYLHSYSDIILYPWGYEEIFTSDHELYQMIGDSISDMNNYDPGTAWELLYPVNGSSDDWSYGEQSLKNKTYAFTIEVGGSSDGFWPAVEDIPELVGENLEPCKFIARIAGNVNQLLPPLSPSITSPAWVDVPDYEVSWTFEDIDNPAVEFELMEMSEYIRVADPADNFDFCTNKDFSISVVREYSAPSSFFSGHENNTYRYVQYEFPFNVQSGDQLVFWTWYDIENDWDYAYVEVSTDGATYATLQGNITTTSDPHGNNRGHGITGESGDWVEAVFDLSNYAGESITLRISYDTDASVLGEGIYVDDIYPVDDFQNKTQYFIDASQNTKQFTDKTDGEYYYKIRVRDAEDQWSEYSNLTSTVVELPQYTVGDANSDEIVDISDAVFLINFVFVPESPVPDPMESANVNCDELVDVSDAVYIINFVFTPGSPLPGDCE